jgi:antagonist of KipI
VTLRIVTGGLQTTVQDLGRMGRQRSGIPVSGAMDHLAHRIGNMLVGNDETVATLEASLLGPAITFEQPALIALTGGDLGPIINGTDVPTWHAISVPEGATLRCGQPRLGCRSYIAVAGGIDVPPVFGSRSTYLRAQFGGHEGRALRSGDILIPGPMSATSRSIAASLRDSGSIMGTARWSVAASLRPRYTDDPVVRLIEGAHYDLLDDASRDQLTSATFKISSNSDRMGYRLSGVELSLREPTELLSEGVAFGTVQLPPGGEPIVLMADHQTTGGYPRIGEVASVDLPLIAQLKPGDRVRFSLVSVAGAQQAYLALEHDLALARTAIALSHSRGTK